MNSERNPRIVHRKLAENEKRLFTGVLLLCQFKLSIDRVYLSGLRALIGKGGFFVVVVWLLRSSILEMKRWSGLVVEGLAVAVVRFRVYLITDLKPSGAQTKLAVWMRPSGITARHSPVKLRLSSPAASGRSCSPTLMTELTLKIRKYLFAFEGKNAFGEK